MCFTIKPLEWEYHERPMMTYVVRDERGLCYHINQYFGSDSYYFATVRHDGKILYDGDDLPSAQAAAQADYEARILSALAPQAGDNAEEPAAWKPFQKPTGSGYKAGYADARADALRELRYSIRDIVEHKEDPKERLGALYSDLEKLEMPTDGRGKG